MWILTKNGKGLIKSNVFYSDHQKVKGKIQYGMVSDDFVFGVYESEERTLEILKEMSRFLIGCDNKSPIVFNMSL